jgi:hypothetical protein
VGPAFQGSRYVYGTKRGSIFARGGRWLEYALKYINPGFEEIFRHQRKSFHEFDDETSGIFVAAGWAGVLNLARAE